MEKEKELLFEARKLTKLFGPTVALDEVDFKVYRGEITGLIGENGSGKSTITSIAAGMQPATSGEMFFEGKPHKPSTMLEGARAGIGMIVQEQGTVPGISIARNIFLGNESQFAKGPIISKAKMNAEAKKALDAIGFTGVDPSMPIESLSMQDRKLVEIAKVVYSRPEMLVVDETTTALSQQGREIIYGIMNRMKEENKAVVFISHDLDELMAKCDTLTVLRDGKLITTLSKDQMNEDVIKRNMVGREMTGAYYRSDYGVPVSSEVVLKAEGITTGTELTFTQMSIVNVVCLILFFLLCLVLFNYTSLGLRIRNMGGNMTAARQSGISTKKTAIEAFLVSSLGVAVAAFIILIRTRSVSGSTAGSVGTDVMVALVLGGMPLSGGPRSKISAGIIGAATITILNSGLTILGLTTGQIQICRGIVFIVVVFVSSFSYRSRLLPR
jgi:ABC-type multidrug transport system ATPase subunit